MSKHLYAKPLHNHFKHRLAAREQVFGIWSSSQSNVVAEILGYSGFDWILLDTEHAANELPALVSQLQALDGSPSAPIARPAWNDMVQIKRLLDAGFMNLLVPMVQNADEARAAVAATRYPPHGVRGVAVSHRGNRFGHVPDYFAKIDRELCLLVQVETRSALEHIESIAAVDGVDAIFIGPSDLAASFGQLGNPGHPDVQAAIKSAAERCIKAGKAAGILTFNEQDARRYMEWGYTFVGVGADLGLLKNGADQLARKFKPA